MGILTSILSILKTIGVVLGWIQQQQEVNQGQQMEAGAEAEKANTDVATTIAAERASTAASDANPSGLRDPDPDSRD